MDHKYVAMKFRSLMLAAATIFPSLSMHAQTDAEQPRKYAHDLLAVSPIQLTENGVAGLGVSYERSLGKEGIVAIYLPIMGVVNTNNRTRLNTTASYPDLLFYAMPGIKIYPTSNQGLAKYAVGPSLVFAAGDGTELLPSNSPMFKPSIVTGTRYIFGMVVNQSLNLNVTQHLYLGTELGLGYSYINKLSGLTRPVRGIVQFSFKVGYRF